jgi:hypothetical protein
MILSLQHMYHLSTYVSKYDLCTLYVLYCVLLQINCLFLKFTFSEKATKIDKIFTINFSNRQIDGKDFINFCGLLRKHEL